jgi:predicted DNA-binding transcriptional regulator AlpA
MFKNYLNFPALSKKLGNRSRSSIHRDMRDRGFPKPINLGPNSVVWDEAAVDEWVEQLTQAEYEPRIVAPGAKRGRKPRRQTESTQLLLSKEVAK